MLLGILGSGSSMTRKRAIYLVCFVITFVYVCYEQESLTATLSPVPVTVKSYGFNSEEDGSEFLVDAPGCRLIHMDPFDSDVNPFFKDSHKKTCKKPLVVLNNNVLKVSEQALKDWKVKGAKCCYRAIHRVQQKADKYDRDADYTNNISKTCTSFGTKGISVKEQFIKVECVNDLDIKVLTDFFPLVPPPEEISPKKAEFWKEFKASQPNETDLPPSIIVIGIDSISRLHMLRSLPRTRELLHAKGFVDLQGYTKVGDNTFPNIMAGFAGLRANEYNSCWPSSNTKLDDCPFIWKNFSALNYLTAHVEDSPGLAIFNFDKTGFVTPPADYYIRPLMVEEHKHHKRNRYGGSNECLAGGKTPTQVLIQYITSVVSQSQGKAPLFLLSWFTSVGHDEFNGLKPYDQEIRDFLNFLVKTVGSNSLLLFISDHGYRFGKFRETFLGFYEEALPFFFVRMPSSLKKRHPEWYQNLKVNGHRLTTPHDLHSTLVDVFNIAQEKVGIGMNPAENEIENSTTNFSSFRRLSPSFFELGKLNRTCEDSFVPQKYCMCGVTPKFSSSKELTKMFGNVILERVNKDVKESNLTGVCNQFSYSKFLYGREVGKGEKWNQFGKLEPYQDYLIAIEAKPWETRFEARIRTWPDRTESKAEVLDSVGRINSYQGKADCIADYIMKNYCICKNLWTAEEAKRDKKKKSKKGKKKKRKRSVPAWAGYG